MVDGHELELRFRSAISAHSCTGYECYLSLNNGITVVRWNGARGDFTPIFDAGSYTPTTGDVLRVDLGIDSGFPNGRPIPGGAKPNQEQADVTDVLLSVILAKGTLAVGDGVNSNDKDYLPELPYLALPHEGFSGGHGKPAP